MTEQLALAAKETQIENTIAFFLWELQLRLRRIDEAKWRLVGGRGVVWGPGSGMGSGRFIKAPTFTTEDLLADDMRTIDEGPKTRSW